MALRRFSTSNISGSKSSKVWDGETFPGYFESIATVVVGSGGSSTVEFTSIPSTYSHLQIRAIVATNRATYGQDDVKITVNSDSGSNYSYHYLAGSGAAATTGNGTSTAYMFLQGSSSTTVSSNVFGAFIVDILDYADTNKYKTIRSLRGVDNNGAVAGYYGFVGIDSGSWRSTSAITSIKFDPTTNGGTAFAQYSHFALYGIRGA